MGFWSWGVLAGLVDVAVRWVAICLYRTSRASNVLIYIYKYLDLFIYLLCRL